MKMVKRAVISDIHGNLEALEAVLADIASQKVDKIYCLGDTIGYGPNPRECIDRVLSVDRCVLGNHDQGALFDPEGFNSGAERAIFWTRDQLEIAGDGGNEQRWKFLIHAPRIFEDGDFMFVHGSARNPLNEYVFPEDTHNTRKLDKIFSLIPRHCLQGHTHVPGVFTEDHKYHHPSEIDYRFRFDKRKTMVNVGSVGQPRDGDTRSCYVILQDDEVEFRRVSYSVETTAAKILAVEELDDSLAYRLQEGR